MSRWALPWLLTSIVGGSTFGSSIAQTLSIFAVRAAPFVGGGILVLWIAAVFKKWIDRRRFEQQSGSRSIGALGWREFESLPSEAFRRQGFIVEHTGKDGPDGGIDQRLDKAGAITLGANTSVTRSTIGVLSARPDLPTKYHTLRAN